MNSEDVVLNYCRDLETKVKKARSREEAERLVREICQSFEQECLSEIKQNFLKKYAEEVLHNMWG